MGLLEILGLRKPAPKPALKPKAPDPRRVGTHAERKAARIAHAKEVAAHLPDSLDSPFFHDLAQRWPDQPSMAAPVSQLCTAAQFEEPDYARLCEMAKTSPALRRKQWEFIYILRAIEFAGGIAPGKRGLAFGIGKETLPSLFAARGCAITATDLPIEGEDQDWVGGDQHAASLEELYRQRFLSRETFEQLVEFRPVNMKAIPDDLRDYDFCWSACALEHLGGIEEGFQFIRDSIECLKPGGLAVHTTEFNLGSADDTLTEGGTVVYREKDLLRFVDEMTAAGHQISLNLAPGDTPTDRMIDRFRDNDIHIRLYISHQIPATSIGLSVIKAA